VYSEVLWLDVRPSVGVFTVISILLHDQCRLSTTVFLYRWPVQLGKLVLKVIKEVFFSISHWRCFEQVNVQPCSDCGCFKLIRFKELYSDSKQCHRSSGILLLNISLKFEIRGRITTQVLFHHHSDLLAFAPLVEAHLTENNICVENIFKPTCLRSSCVEEQERQHDLVPKRCGTLLHAELMPWIGWLCLPALFQGTATNQDHP
jgi:hypothetical protein